MSPKSDNQEFEAKPDVTVDIPHDEKTAPPAPITAPPLPQLEPLPVRPINITDNAPTPPPAVPVAPPELSHEFHEHEGRRWPVILIYTSLAFLVALLVVFAGRWLYHKVADNKLKPQPGGNNQGKTPPLPPASNQTSPSTPVITSAPNAGQNGQLPNNGPGNVAAVFVGTALAFGGLHFLYNLRKQN